MTDIVTFENIVRSWVETASSRDCYIQEQMGPVPKDPYCTIHMKEISFPQYDVLNYECNGDTLDLTVRGQAMVTYAISAWGGTAAQVMATCQRIRNSIYSDSRYYQYENAARELPGLWSIAGKGMVGNIIVLPEEYEGERRQRAEFDFTLHTTLQDTFDQDYFDEITGVCNVDNGDKIGTITIGINDADFAVINDDWQNLDTIWSLIG